MALTQIRQTIINEQYSGVVPIGGIIMFSGNIASLPSGWSFCNGSNGTPDLRDKFIIGAYADSSGQANTTVTGSTTKNGGTANLIVPSHSHTATSTFTGNALSAHGHAGSTTDNHPGHTHTVLAIAGGGGSILGGSGSRDPGTATTSNSGAHSHAVTVSTASAGTPSGTVGTTVDTAGSSGTNANLPPYYALAFIMRIS